MLVNTKKINSDIASKVDKTTTINDKALSGNVALTTNDVPDSTNKRYVTDANLTTIGNQTGTNTGDETTSTIKSKLGITTLSGVNTGDQTLPTLSSLGGAPISNPTFTGNVTVTNLYSTNAYGTFNGNLYNSNSVSTIYAVISPTSTWSINSGGGATFTTLTSGTVTISGATLSLTNANGVIEMGTAPNKVTIKANYVSGYGLGGVSCVDNSGNTIWGFSGSPTTCNLSVPSVTTNRGFGSTGLGLLPDASSVAWDASTKYFTVALALTTGLGSNTRSIGAPSNTVAGAFYSIYIQQPGSGASQTVTWNSIFKFPGGTTPTLSTTNNAKDFFVFQNVNGTFYCIFQGIGMA